MTEPTFKTTLKQQQQLLTDGFVHLPGVVPHTLLNRLRELSDSLESNAIQAHQRGESIHGACVIEDPAGPRLMRQDDILGLDGELICDLLGCPAMMAIAREMCGQGSVPLQADILYKHQHPHPVIKWHQGAQHSRSHPYLNIGIYLDDSDANDGCLRYIPGTQHQLQDICTLSKSSGWDIPGMVEQPAKAGDILVQDMMILHGSPPKRSPGARRTIYVELRPADAIVEGAAQSQQWADLRKRWMSLVLRHAHPSDWPALWRNDLPSELASDKNEIDAILSHWEAPIPAVYCPHEIETTNYPVPSDLVNSK